MQTTAHTNAADGSALTSTIIIGVTAAGVGILVIVLVIGFVIYCKRLKNPEPEYEPYATYMPPTDDSSQHQPIDLSGPELPGHLPVAYSTYVPSPDNSSQRPPISTPGPELPGNLPVSYSTYIPPNNSTAHQHVDPLDYEIPLENMGNENVGDDLQVTTDQSGYIEVIA
ncbi:uncharacterized protein [Amphiura filiformis]